MPWTAHRDNCQEVEGKRSVDLGGGREDKAVYFVNWNKIDIFNKINKIFKFLNRMTHYLENSYNKIKTLHKKHWERAKVLFRGKLKKKKKCHY